MNKIILACIFLCLFTVQVSGQDPLYTNFSNAALSYNPAMTGLFTGLRTRFIYRDQHPALASEWRSYHMSADLGDRNLPGSGGVGIILNSDDEGLGFIHNYEVGASVAARISFNRYMAGQLGVRASWLEKRAKVGDVNSILAIVERYGFMSDSIMVNDLNNLSVNATDFSVGGVLQFASPRGCYTGNVGFSVNHIFEPDVSLIPETRVVLPRKWVGHADFVLSVRCPSGFYSGEDESLKLNPGVVVVNQGANTSIQAGMNIAQYGIYFGAWFRTMVGKSNENLASLSGGYRYAFSENISIKLTYSYEMNITGCHGNGGAHEVGVVIELGKIRIFQNSIGSNYRSSDTPEGNDTFLACSDF